jgi:hypothetical protein
MNQPSRAAVQDSLKQAQMSFNQGNFSVAEPIYKQLLDTIPPESEEYALCLHNLGEINEQRGNLTTAIWWQTRLLSHPLMTEESMVHQLFSRMGHIAALYTKAGRPSEATQTYQQMAILQPRLQATAPSGFTPQSEIGTFLRGVLDQAHRKFSNDAAETQLASEALQQMQSPSAMAASTADEGIPEALRPFQTHNHLAATESFGNQLTGPNARGFDPAQLNAIQPPGMNQANQNGATAGGVASRGFNPSDLDAIGTPATRRAGQTGSQDVPSPSDQTGDTSLRGMRRVGIGEVEHAPSEMEARMEGLANAWTQISNSKFAGPVFVGVIIAVLAVLFNLPYSGSTTKAFKSMPSEYATIDGSMSIYLRDMNTIEFRTNKEKTDLPYKFYFGDPREAVFLSAGQLPEKQYWLTDTRDQNGTALALTDDKGLTYYSSKGPEAQLYLRMKQIADTVAIYYNSHNNAYPSSDTDFTSGEMTYRNPFTSAAETATIQYTALDVSTKKGVQALGEFYDNLSQSKGWEKKPQLTPGAIQCCTAALNTSGGPVHVFAIVAGDRQGKPLLGPNGQAFYIALEEGKPHELVAPPPSFISDGTFRRRLIVILEKPIDANLTFIVHGLPCWLFTVLAFICGCIFVSLPKRAVEKPIAIVFIVLFGLGAVLYTINGRI